MTRLQRLIKLVEEEQDVVRQSKTPVNVDALCRHQDRLLTYCARNNKTAPYELFQIPGPLLPLESVTTNIVMSEGK